MRILKVQKRAQIITLNRYISPLFQEINLTYIKLVQIYV